MSRLGELMDGKRMVEAKKIAREYDIQTVDEAKDVIDVYQETNYHEKGVKGQIESLKKLIPTFENMNKTNGKHTASIELWKKDLRQLEKALRILNEAEHQKSTG